MTADITSGCDTMTVHFAIANNTTYSLFTWLIDNEEQGINDSIIAKDIDSFDFTFTIPGVYSVRCAMKRFETDNAKVLIKENWLTLSITPYLDFDFDDQAPASDDELKFAFENLYFKPIGGMDLNYTWRWFKHDDPLVQDESNDSIPVFDFTTEGEGLYDVFLKIEDQVGCKDSITKTIHLLKDIHVPTAFSPNGDGTNDYLEVYFPVDDVYHFKVFTREGLQVYSTSAPSVVWDGKTIGDQDVPAGIYFYIIESEGDGVRTPQKGFIYVFR